MPGLEAPPPPRGVAQKSSSAYACPIHTHLEPAPLTETRVIPLEWVSRLHTAFTCGAVLRAALCRAPQAEGAGLSDDEEEEEDEGARKPAAQAKKRKKERGRARNPFIDDAAAEDDDEARNRTRAAWMLTLL